MHFWNWRVETGCSTDLLKQGAGSAVQSVLALSGISKERKDSLWALVRLLLQIILRSSALSQVIVEKAREAGSQHLLLATVSYCLKWLLQGLLVSLGLLNKPHRSALGQGPACVQTNPWQLSAWVAESGTCLHLRVWVPEFSSGDISVQ